MIFKRRTSVTPAHWPFIMAKLKSSALAVIGSNEARMSLMQSDSQRAYHYEAFLSEIDDALELSRNLLETDKSFCKVNLNQVAADLCESLTQRYGPEFVTDFSLLIDHNLPVTQSHPYAVMRLLDCLIRGVERVRSKRQFDVAVRQQLEGVLKDTVRLTIACNDLSLPCEFDRAKAALNKFQKGDYLATIHDLGLDFCAAFHLVRQLNGRVHLERAERKLVNLRVEFALQLSTEQFPAVAPPSRFMVISDNVARIEGLKHLAEFHNSAAVVVTEEEQIDGSEWLVYDATTAPSEQTVEEIKKLPNPDQTIILVSPGVRTWQRELFLAGFRSFVSLPLVSPKILRALNGIDARTQPRKLSSTPKPKHGLSVLIVDDTATARIILRDYFEENGFTVTEATDGSEFTDLIKKGRRFDLIFSDVTMAHMDGITAVKILREHEKQSGEHTPVVLMTSYSAQNIAEQAASSGMDSFLEKPIEREKLEQVVKQLITSVPEPGSNELQETEIIVLENLKQRCAGRTRTMVRVLDSFILMAQEYSTRMQSEELQHNHEELKKALHTIKGLLREISAQESAKTVELLEDKLRSLATLNEEDLSTVNQVLDSARRSAESVKQLLSS